MKVYEEMSSEELITEIKRLEGVKNEAFEQRDLYKTKYNDTSTKFEEVSTKLNEFTQKQEKAVLTQKLSGLNIQDKFKEDLVVKAGITAEMDDKSFKEAIAKTLEVYPEYKKPNINTEVKVPAIGKTVDMKAEYNKLINKKRK